MNIQFNAQEQFISDIEIESLGSVCIVANNDEADEWYLNIQTDLGWTEVEQFGPLTIDDSTIGYYFNYNYNKFEFNEKRLFKIINDFLNNTRNEITQAMIIDADEFYERLHSLEKQKD